MKRLIEMLVKGEIVIDQEKPRVKKERGIS